MDYSPSSPEILKALIQPISWLVAPALLGAGRAAVFTLAGL